MAIKIFTSFDLDHLEDKVNKWLTENNEIKILQFDFDGLTILIRYTDDN